MIVRLCLSQAGMSGGAMTRGVDRCNAGMRSRGATSYNGTYVNYTKQLCFDYCQLHLTNEHMLIMFWQRCDAEMPHAWVAVNFLWIGC